MRHRAAIAVSCLKTNWRFFFFEPLRASSQKLLLKRTTAGRRALSTTSLTLFEAILSMIVLSAGRHAGRQSSDGMAARAAQKASAASDALVVLVLFFCAAVCLPLSPFPPPFLPSDISLRLLDFPCVWPDDETRYGRCRVPTFTGVLSEESAPKGDEQKKGGKKKGE
jgi:hypothetical protein